MSRYAAPHNPVAPLLSRVPRLVCPQRFVVQSAWLLPLVLVLLAVKCQAELCVATVYLDMYPCLRRLQRVRHSLMTRTDEIIKSVMPFPLIPEDIRQLQHRDT